MFFYLIPMIIFSALSLLEYFNILKLGKSACFLGFFLLALIGGLRFQTGADWSAYVGYFDNIDISLNPIASYIKSSGNSIEIGYFFLNYFIKFIGGNYSTLVFIIAIFLSASVYWFTSKFDVNKWFILTAFVSFDFLPLYFSQMRQALAISFFMLACRYYLNTSKKFKSFLIALLSPFFQISSFLYLFLMIASFFKEKAEKCLLACILVLLCLLVCSFLGVLDLYRVLAHFLILTPSFSAKFLLYAHAPKHLFGIEKYYFGLCMIFPTLYLYINRQAIANSVSIHFISNYAVNSLLTTGALMVVFYANSSMWVRLFYVTSIFVTYTLALIAEKQNLPFRLLIIPLGLLFYWSIYIYELIYESDVFIPYQSVLSQ